jgi:ABC-type multidrug transport system fused ATPase/permease subunit
MTSRDDLRNFGLKKIREIKIWAWAAAVLPIVALAGVFFVWIFGTDEMLNISMIIGSTTMFTVAVIWWWWAIHSIYNLIVLWNRTDETMQEVKVDLKEIKTTIREFFYPSDK